MSTSDLKLSVRSADRGAELFVLDHSFTIRAQAVAELTTDVPPGLYKVRLRIGSAVREAHVALEPGKARAIGPSSGIHVTPTPAGANVWFDPASFPSPIPLQGTSRTHEYHMSNATAIGAGTPQWTHGQGAQLLVFARAWSRDDEKGRSSGWNPLRGVSIRNGAGELIVELDRTAKTDTSGDPWAGCRGDVSPGAYSLGREDEGGSTEMSLFVPRGWEMQVFLFLSLAGRERRVPTLDLGRAAVLLSRRHFDPLDPAWRLTEQARQGLALRRATVVEQDLRNMLYGKFESPMLGIYGGHLLLLREPVNIELLRDVVGNLRDLVQTHPDVEALALAADMEPAAGAFTYPPMLASSWDQIVRATIRRPDLVPADSPAARVAACAGVAGAWLQWGQPCEERRRSRQDFDSTLDPAEQRVWGYWHDVYRSRAQERPKAPRVGDFSRSMLVQNLRMPASVIDDALGSLHSRVWGRRDLFVAPDLDTRFAANAVATDRKETALPRYCFASLRPTGADKTRAAAWRASMWAAREKIRISFLDGAPQLCDRVVAVAKRWVASGLARLTFEFRKDASDTDIRISFRHRGSWSQVGTSCRAVPRHLPTMNFGWLTVASTDVEVQQVVLHEFGHALGLLHEHQSPADGIHWNKDVIYAELSGPPNNWSRDQIDFNIFEAFDAVETNFTRTDPTSIMTYPIPQEWTLDGFEVGMNSTFSEVDRAFIAEVYP